MDFVSSSMTRHALISWPNVNGVASCRWVRPNLTIAAFSCSKRVSVPINCSIAGYSLFFMYSTPAMCIAAGNVSLEL